MEEFAKLEYAETAAPIKRRRMKRMLTLLLAGSLAVIAVDQGTIVFRKPISLQRETETTEYKANMKPKHLSNAGERILEKEGLLKTTAEASVDSGIAFPLVVSTEWDSFPGQDADGMYGSDEMGEETGAEGVIVVPDNPMEENLVTDEPIPDHSTPDQQLPDRQPTDPPTEDHPATDNPVVDHPTTDHPSADGNGESMSGDAGEDVGTGDTGNSDVGSKEEGSINGGVTEEENNGATDENGTKDPAADETPDSGTDDGGAENPAIPESAWIVDESGMLCQIYPELLEIDDGVLYLPEGIFTGIRSGAFSDIPGGIYEIVLPPTLTVIEEGALAKLTELEWIEANGSVTFVSEDGVLFDAERKEILAFPSGKTGAYIVPPTVEKIAGSAFENSRLERLDLWECGWVEMDAGMFGTGNGNGMTIAVPGGSLPYYEQIFAGCSIQLI